MDFSCILHTLPKWVVFLPLQVLLFSLVVNVHVLELLDIEVLAVTKTRNWRNRVLEGFVPWPAEIGTDKSTPRGCKWLKLTDLDVLAAPWLQAWLP